VLLLGSAHARIPPAKTRTMRIRLRHSALAKLGARTSIPALEVIKMRLASGAPVTSTRHITLRLHPKRKNPS
jgi:hypothetical protein